MTQRLGSSEFPDDVIRATLSRYFRFPTRESTRQQKKCQLQVLGASERPEKNLMFVDLSVESADDREYGTDMLYMMEYGIYGDSFVCLLSRFQFQNK